MKMPEWAHLEMAEIDFQDWTATAQICKTGRKLRELSQDIVYYSRPKSKAKKQSLDEA